MPVRIIWRGLLGEVSEAGKCIDISEGGIAFETDADLDVGEIIDLECGRRGADRFRLRVRLLRKMGNRYGACFVSPGP